jgi:NAD(P)-dependent dehydrogenase (short-subunit alcohol dehydrogenase family)
MENLTGKTILITGAGDGVGKCLAFAFAAEGAAVVVNDIGKDENGAYVSDKVVSEIRNSGGNAFANHDSVANIAGGEAIIHTAIENTGRIDGLVNCAGNHSGKAISETSEEIWDSIIDVHLKGHFSCIKAALPHMIKQDYGRIINFSSRAAFDTARSGNVAYAAAKAGILGFTATLSADPELKNHNITANAIIPSAITRLFPMERPRFGGGPTLGPEYVVPIIVYLATEAAAGVTGQFFYSSSGDIVIFDQPMKLPGPHRFIRKYGNWTIEELNETIPPMLGIK